MVFVKHNSLKSDIFFNPIFIPGFSGSGSRVWDNGPGSRVQGPGPSFRSSRESINKMNIRNTKVVYLHKESLTNLSLYMLINVMLIKKTCTSKSFVALSRLGATTVDCAHELINGRYRIKGETGKILQN